LALTLGPDAPRAGWLRQFPAWRSERGRRSGRERAGRRPHPPRPVRCGAGDARQGIARGRDAAQGQPRSSIRSRWPQRVGRAPTSQSSSTPDGRPVQRGRPTGSGSPWCTGRGRTGSRTCWRRGRPRSFTKASHLRWTARRSSLWQTSLATSYRARFGPCDCSPRPCVCAWPLERVLTGRRSAPFSGRGGCGRWHADPAASTGRTSRRARRGGRGTSGRSAQGWLWGRLCLRVHRRGRDGRLTDRQPWPA
jgi:hypothetical protein